MARLPPFTSQPMAPKKCAAPTMKKSIVNEKIVFWREAIAAFRPAAAASGSASPPASTLRALAITLRWFGQITSHTFANIVTARRMPVAIAMPSAVFQ